MNQQLKSLSEIIQDIIDYIQAVAEGKQPPMSRQHARQVLEEAAVQLPKGEKVKWKNLWREKFLLTNTIYLVKKLKKKKKIIPLNEKNNY